MTSLALMAGALFASLHWGLGFTGQGSLIMTLVLIIVLAGYGSGWRRRPNKVVIVQDLETGASEFQPMDAATRRYLATRRNETEND